MGLHGRGHGLGSGIEASRTVLCYTCVGLRSGVSGVSFPSAHPIFTKVLKDRVIHADQCM